ncbi:hypothetical protein HWE04_09965 [Herbaspirillum sp. C7C2]|uniref:hypothetical protein n=1 Tax=Herbaspirillum sp. C7C2 TaxID=2736666 RepID=UPI001F51F6F2|nr:hypothetical protein [Herbaspirillum sp. C7C2]MCI1014181.1 hypothetical protein [Herbaspirillum sp. C7C2]
MKVYENVVIGNFLFGFGAHVGARVALRQGHTKNLPLAIDLLQQTPLDAMVADLVVRGSRMMRILEFKRTENKDSKEIHKRSFLERLLSQEPHLGDISRSVHWYVSAGQGLPENCGIEKLCPYLDFERAPINQNVDLNGFFQAMADEALGLGPDLSLTFTMYLNALAATHTAEGSGSSGGFIISVGEGGRINYSQVDDFRHLNYSLRQYHAQYLVQERAKEQERTLVREHKLEKTQERGMSL